MKSTRTEYLAHLTASYEATLVYGGNEAIRRHRDKVALMDDAQFQAHRAKLQDSSHRRAATVKRLAAEIVRRTA